MAGVWDSLPTNLRLMAAMFDEGGVDRVPPELVGKIRTQLNEEWPPGPSRAADPATRPRERISPSLEEAQLDAARATVRAMGMVEQTMSHLMRNIWR